MRSTQEVVKRCSQTVNIRTHGCLRRAVLLRGTIALRKSNESILAFSWCKQARNTKINQINLTVGGDHYISWLQITKDDGRLVGQRRMQVIQHVSKLKANLEHFVHRQPPAVPLQ